MRPTSTIPAGLAGAVAVVLAFLAPTGPGIADAPRIYCVAADGSEQFRTIAELNDAALPRGSIVRLRRGDIFAGTGIKAWPGTTYEAYGQGPKPVIADVDGIGFSAADETVLRDIAIVNTTGAGAWIEGVRDVAVERVDFDLTSTHGHSPQRSVSVYRSQDVTIRDSTFERTGGNNHIYVYATGNPRVLGNRIAWHGPGDGDGIQMTDVAGFEIAHNRVTSLAGGKGAIIVSAGARPHPEGGLIAHNDITGGQFGISVRAENAVVRNNAIRDVGRQPHSRSWATGIWIAVSEESEAKRDIAGIEVHDNLITRTRQAIGGWDGLPGAYLTEVSVRHNTIVDATSAYLHYGGGILGGTFSANVVVDAGAMALGPVDDGWTFADNVFYLVDGEADSGGDPRLTRAKSMIAQINGAAGLRNGARVGPSMQSSPSPGNDAAECGARVGSVS